MCLVSVWLAWMSLKRTAGRGRAMSYCNLLVTMENQDFTPTEMGALGGGWKTEERHRLLYF